MSLIYYHAEPAANSLKSMICLHEKGLEFESRYVDLHKFEQHSEWFVAINPEGQVPVLVHDGAVITQTSVINEYLEDVFPENPLRPADAVTVSSYWKPISPLSSRDADFQFASVLPWTDCAISRMSAAVGLTISTMPS